MEKPLKRFVGRTIIALLLISIILAVPYLQNYFQLYFNSSAITDELEGLAKAYDRLYYDRFFSTRDWEKGFDEYQSALEPYGERATIAWPFSPYLESEVLMYKATKDPIYLNRVIDVMDKILDLRDSEVGRINEYGESPPIWSAGSRYGFGKSILKKKNGEEVVEVLAYGTTEAEAEGAGELSKGNDNTYITVSEGSEEGTFLIRIENENKDFDRTYDGLTLREEGIVSDDNSVRITVLKSCDELPVFQKKEYIGNILTPRPVHTGLLFNPMLQLAESIREEKLNDYYQEKAGRYIEAAIAALEYHEGDWIAVDEQRGYYSGFVRENEKDTRPLPWNQMFEPGRMLIRLYNITGEEQYKEKVERMINYYMDYIDYDEEKDLYIWKYGIRDGYTAAESVNYARLDMTFIYEAYKAGISFTEEDMNRFVNTYRKNVFRDDGTIANKIDGKGKYNRKNWINFARINFLSEWGDDCFFNNPVKWIEEDINGESEEFGKLIAIARSIYQKRIIDPEYIDITDQKKLGEYRK